ncbi:hypothetical protein [Phytohalomonas tamaricis]|uniref:hypothetical protein n=1 Tax=Phytohalomonas tamaricis TaxID=2081032 RepID=UPI000D0AFEF3|nr:hypothetical protein [Phytohalomonas tamaricis]
MNRHFHGACCPECKAPLSWPRHASDHQLLRCPNGHPLCTMKEFRQAAYELALMEEMQLHRNNPTHYSTQGTHKLAS